MSLTLLALAGAAPIALVFVLLVGVRWSAARAMGAGWFLASALGLALWRMETAWWAAAAVYGALQALQIILIVFGAILLMNHVQRSGAITTIRWHFTRITKDARVQLLLIGLGFVTLMEGAAGFGTPGALAAPLLIGLGFPPLAGAVFGLFFNAPQPPFGAAGTPVIGGVGAVIDEGVLGPEMTVPEFLDAVTGHTAIVTGSSMAFWGLVAVFLLTYWFGREEERSLRGAVRSTAEVMPLAFFLGAVTGLTQFVVAWFLGPELPNMASGFLVLGVGIFAVRRGFLLPKRAWSFPPRDFWLKSWLGLRGSAPPKDKAGKEMPVILAWAPYLLVLLVLMVTRWPGLGMADWLRERTLDIDRILGQDLSFSLEYLYSPGVLPFIPVALLTAVMHRMSRAEVAVVWSTSLRQIVSPAVTLIVAVSMTQVIIQSATNTIGEPGMMQALSRVVASGVGSALPSVAPLIGMLGSFMTGSNTSSNVLFSVLQHDAALDVGVSATIVVALQNAGGGIGNLVSVLNVAAICGVIRMSGMESEILRKLIVPALFLAVFAGALGLLMVRFGPVLY